MNVKPQISSLSETVSEEASTTRDIATSTSTVPSPTHQNESSRTESRSTMHHQTEPRLSLRNFLEAFKSYVLSSEDDLRLKSIDAKSHIKTHEHIIDRDPMFVIVDSSCLSNPSSRELVVDKKSFEKENVQKKYLHENVITNETPSTIEISETSLEALIPSYPASPRSLNIGSFSPTSSVGTAKDVIEAVDFLHEDIQFLLAAETGNVDLLTVMIRTGTNVKQTDLLGRNALHLAMYSNNVEAIKLLLQAGVDPNAADDIGMTPLVLCLMRRPSLAVANLLFQYGAKILPRVSRMDTGIFIQFVMMCAPTAEESLILRLLVKKGALVDDLAAPGGRQALHFAAMSDNCPLIHILMELGADVFLTNHRDETPKEVAISFNCTKAAKLLNDFEETLISCSTSKGVKNK